MFHSDIRPSNILVEQGFLGEGLVLEPARNESFSTSPVVLTNQFNLAFYRNGNGTKKKYCTPNYLSPDLIREPKENEN